MSSSSGRILNFGALTRRSNCRLIDSKPENRCSGGFYDQSRIPCGKLTKCDPYFAIIYVLEGCGEYSDYLGRSFTLGPGRVVIRHPDASFSTIKRLNPAGLWLEFAAALPMCLYKMMITSGVILPDTTYLNPGISEDLVVLADEYIRSLESAETSPGRLDAFASFLQLMSAMLRLDNDNRSPGCSTTRHQMNQARNILSGQFDKKLMMESVARRLGMSYEAFRKRFTQTYGCSPNEFRIRRRLDQADSLLLHTDLSIKEIAFGLGYSAVSSFTRQYTAFRHCTPSNARRYHEQPGTRNVHDSCKGPVCSRRARRST